MEDRLERILNRVVDWLKYEEAKNGALIAVDGAVAGAIMTWSTPRWNVMSFCLACSSALLLLSLLIALVSFYPVLKSDQLDEPWTVYGLWVTWLRERLGHSQRATKKGSLLFFADIAGSNADDYLKDLRASASEKAGTPLELDYAHQIIVCSHIAIRKARYFETAFLFGFMAFVFALLATIARVAC